MCPPPAEPIPPLGPVAGGTFVDRTSGISRVTRRERREDQDEDEDDQQRRERHHELLESWSLSSADVAHEAGVYDDHGRAVAAEHETEDAPRIDTTA